MSRQISKTFEHHENHLDQTKPKWFAVYTHYKREKVAAKYLSDHSIECYLPIQNVTRKYVRKIKHLELPLINNYLFVKITKEHYSNVLKCPYILNFVKFSNNLISIPEAEIALMQRILGESNGFFLDQNFSKGDTVEVIGGNLTGLTGILIDKENGQFLCVQLKNIGFSLNVSIASHLLRTVKQNPSLSL